MANLEKKIDNHMEVFKDPYQEILDSPDVPFSLRWKIIKEIDRSNTIFLVFTLFMYYWNKWLSALILNKEMQIKILEIGPGSGTLAMKILNWAGKKKFNIEYSLYDSQSDVLNECGKKFEKFQNVKKIHATPNYLKDFKSNQFDITFSLHVLHHIQPKSLALEAINEMLRISNKAVIIFDFEKQKRGFFVISAMNYMIGGSKELVHDGINSLKRSYALDDIKEDVKKLCDQHGYTLVVKKFKIFPYLAIYAYRNN